MWQDFPDEIIHLGIPDLDRAKSVNFPGFLFATNSRSSFRFNWPSGQRSANQYKNAIG